ncbi:MAG TPA: MarR family winged helix-turn-helix transcriptional regulator [Acidobacteriaceae bacterium]|nr:MarR family winged helix-turn-helix transcriptional regulator [Acidobacteriaceae bacterium]
MKHDKGKRKEPKAQRKAVEARTCTLQMRRLTVGYRSLLEDMLRGEGLTLPQLRLLRAVKEQTDVSAAALARTCVVTPQTMQAVLARAVQAQWIVRGKSAKNERYVTATLTPLGESILATGVAMAARIEERIWSGAGLSDMKRLNEMLEGAIAKIEGDTGQ